MEVEMYCGPGLLKGVERPNDVGVQCPGMGLVELTPPSIQAERRVKVRSHGRPPIHDHVGENPWR